MECIKIDQTRSSFQNGVVVVADGLLSVWSARRRSAPGSRPLAHTHTSLPALAADLRGWQAAAAGGFEVD